MYSIFSVFDFVHTLFKHSDMFYINIYREWNLGVVGLRVGWKCFDVCSTLGWIQTPSMLSSSASQTGACFALSNCNCNLSRLCLTRPLSLSLSHTRSLLPFLWPSVSICHGVTTLVRLKCTSQAPFQACPCRTTNSVAFVHIRNLQLDIADDDGSDVRNRLCSKSSSFQS